MKSFAPEQMKLNMVAYRMRKGLTQYDVADILKVHPKTVSRWENDPGSMSLDALDALAIIYGCQVKDFFVD